MLESEPMLVNAHTQSGQVECDALLALAEREFVAFTKAVTELFGTEEARLSAEDWLSEVATRNCLPGPTSREWRLVTAAALARLTIRTAAAHQNSRMAADLRGCEFTGIEDATRDIV